MIRRLLPVAEVARLRAVFRLRTPELWRVRLLCDRAGLISLLLALMVAAGSIQAADPAATWDLAPYRISVLLAVDPGLSLGRDFGEALRADLPARAQAAMGGAWQLDALPAPLELRHAMLASLGEIRAAELPAEAVKGDKVILLSVNEAGSVFVIAARELDLTTQLWNAVVTRRTVQSEQVTAETLRTLIAAFAPLARIEAVDAGTLTLRFKAGAIGRQRPIQPGSLFRPVLVPTDAEGKFQPKSAQPIDWTWLSVTSGGSSVVTCRIDTGLAGEPIPAYHPGRSRLALAVTAPQAGTRLRLVTSGAEETPLEGAQVLVQSPEGADPTSGDVLLTSDREGLVSVPAAAGAVRIVQVRQGEQTLAQVPLVPGLAETVTLSLPDDRQRLVMETLLLEAQDWLVDLTARRQALASRVKFAKKAGGTENAGKLTEQLRSLAGVEPASRQLAQVEKLLASADERTKSLVQPKLDALRKLAQELAAQTPLSLLGEAKGVEAKGGDAKVGEAKSTEAKK